MKKKENIPWGEIMKYRNNNELKSIYEYPVFIHEYPIIYSEMKNDYKILDVGCGEGKFYNEWLLPNGFNGIYIGIDIDPTLPSIVNFPLYSSIKEFKKAGFNIRSFDMLLMLNFPEHLGFEEFYSTVKILNPYIDSDFVIMTPNPRCFDYMFDDPQHKTFFAYEPLYGIMKLFDFPNINIWRGKGLYQIREEQFKKNNNLTHLMEMNEFQRRICIAMGLDWYGNLLVLGERNNE